MGKGGGKVSTMWVYKEIQGKYVTVTMYGWMSMRTQAWQSQTAVTELGLN